MPNSPARRRKGFIPISGELMNVTRRDNAIQQRAARTATHNNELGSGTGPATTSTGSTSGGVDDYTPEDQGRYYG